VTLTETAAPPGLASTVHARFSNALPLIGLGFAAIVDAAWIVFLGYEFFRFVEFVF